MSFRPHLASLTHPPLSTLLHRGIATTSIPESYTVTPPIKPWPQHLTSKRLVSILSRQPTLDLAVRIFEYASKHHRNETGSFSHTYHTYDAIIHKLSRARDFTRMESLLSQLLRSQIKCQEQLFVSVIRNYGLAGKPDLSFQTFARLHEFNVKRTVKSFNTMLNALVQNKRHDLVHFTFRDCRTKYGVVPNVSTCNILVKGMCQKGHVEGAVKVLDEMPAMGLVPNVVTYTTLLGGYASRGDMLGAKKVFGELLDRGWVADAVTYTVLMAGYCKQGRLLEAVKVMDEMEENGVEPNDVTYGVMVEAYCKWKRSGEARNLLDDMLERGYTPTPMLCCKVVDVLCEDGKVEDACGLWRRMLKKNCLQDGAIVETLVHWLCKEGKVWEARKMFGEIEKGEIPSVLSYNMVIAGMCEIGELGEAGRLWDDMVEKGCKLHGFTYDALIKGFCKIGSAKEAVGILEEMVDKGFLPSKLTYKILIEGLLESGMRGEVGKVVWMAMDNGGVDSDSWSLLVKKLVGNLDEGVNALDGLVMENAT